MHVHRNIDWGIFCPLNGLKIITEINMEVSDLLSVLWIHHAEKSKACLLNIMALRNNMGNRAKVRCQG